MTASTQLSRAAQALLEEKRFGVLATINSDGTAQLSTMWFELQDGEIMMNTKRGRVKERNLRRDPRVSLCIEDGYRYLTLRGSVTLTDDPEVSQADIKRLAIRYHGTEKAEQQVRDQYSREDRVTVRLRIDHIVEYGLNS